MFLFKRKENYDYLLSQEIKLCKENGLDLEKYVTPKTNPLHAAQIRKALFDEFPEELIRKISSKKYDNESDIINLRTSLFKDVSLKYFLENYKPKVIKENKKIDPNDVLVGTILGDIIGSKYEFTTHEKIADLYNARLFFTDDTVLSLATKLAILENPNNPDYAKHYKKLYNKYPRAGYGSGFANWALSDSDTGYNSCANGSAMRVSFVGAYYENIDDVIKNAYNSSIVTHNHMDGIKGSVVTAVIIWMCKNNYTKKEIKEYLYSHYDYTQSQLSNKSYGFNYYRFNSKDNNGLENGIWANYSVPYAFDCLLNSNSYEDCMFRILDNPCDSDTVCAIAGGAAILFFKEDPLKFKGKILDKLPNKLIDYLGV